MKETKEEECVICWELTDNNEYHEIYHWMKYVCWEKECCEEFYREIESA